MVSIPLGRTKAKPGAERSVDDIVLTSSAKSLILPSFLKIDHFFHWYQIYHQGQCGSRKWQCLSSICQGLSPPFSSWPRHQGLPRLSLKLRIVAPWKLLDPPLTPCCILMPFMGSFPTNVPTAVSTLSPTQPAQNIAFKKVHQFSSIARRLVVSSAICIVLNQGQTCHRDTFFSILVLTVLYLQVICQPSVNLHFQVKPGTVSLSNSILAISSHIQPFLYPMIF